MTKSWLSYALVLLASTSVADPRPAADKCPQAVKAAITRAFPKGSLTTCKAEREGGHDQFEVRVTRAGGAVAEVDVSRDGVILQIEEKIAVDQIPAAVAKSFAKKYPKAKIDRAEKQTPAHGTPSYELAFASDRGRKEATFAEDGTFVEEE